MTKMLDLAFFPAKKPDEFNLLMKNGYHPAHYREALKDVLKVINAVDIEPHHDLILDEIFASLTQEAYNFLFPRIINAYLIGRLDNDGNFATQFLDSLIDNHVDWIANKYGGEKIRDRHRSFLKDLNSEQEKIIKSAINELLSE